MKRFTIIILSLLLSVALSAQVKYVFYFIGDGMGLNHVLMTEMYREAMGMEPLCFTSFPTASYATTFSTDSDVTDSAASGTALACGSKTSNGRIGVDANGETLVSVAEQAKAKGLKVGVLTNVTANHATPAAFCAHQNSRNNVHEISLDMLQNAFDFYGGSGMAKDKKDKNGEKLQSVMEQFRSAGYTVCNPTEWKKRSKKIKKVLMLPGEGQSIEFALDMEAGDPENHIRLVEQTDAAISLLSRNNRKGFFLMVEGGRIDYTAHSNDAAATIAEINEFNEAIKSALSFYHKHPDETLILITADHETGGLTLNPRKKGQLATLSAQKHSISHISKKLRDMLKDDENLNWVDVQEFLRDEFGFWDKIELSEKQEDRLKEVYEQTIAQDKAGSVVDLYSNNATIVSVASQILSEICCLHWSTSGHSSGYVPVYAIGKGASLFSSKNDNALIPQKLREIVRY